MVVYCPTLEQPGFDKGLDVPAVATSSPSRLSLFRRLDKMAEEYPCQDLDGYQGFLATFCIVMIGDQIGPRIGSHVF